MNSRFERYIGIDYSGAQTPSSSLKGLRVYVADGSNVPQEVQPPPSPRKYWTRRGVAESLVEQLSEDARTLVGIDHGFSFPLQYFEQYGLPLDWPSFLDDFQRHWPTDENIYVDFAKSTHAGIPWLRYIRKHVKDRVHFWPFDGWSVPPNRSVIAEVYPALWSRTFPSEGRTQDQQDAFATAKWLEETDRDGSLQEYLRPRLESDERRTAEVEGWILGIL